MYIAFIWHHLRIISGQWFSWKTHGWILRMGTKILQRSLPDWTVVRCERIEDALLWEKYTAKRAQHHVCKVWRVFWVLYQAFRWSNCRDWGNKIIESSQNKNCLEFPVADLIHPSLHGPSVQFFFPKHLCLQDPAFLRLRERKVQRADIKPVPWLLCPMGGRTEPPWQLRHLTCTWGPGCLNA